MTFPRIRRIGHKLARIGPRPVLLLQYALHHIRAGLGQRRLRRGYIAVVTPPLADATLVAPPIDLVLASALPDALKPSAERVHLEAMQLLSHRIELLGSGLVEIGEQIDWHRDFKSGYRWESAFYQDVEIVRLSDDSDPKFPWELSRSHHLLTLARAARLFGDDRFMVELERQLSAWLDQNPTGYGINWTSSMEVAIRAVNWVWAIGTLDPWRSIDPNLRDRVTASLQAHARHIATNLEGTPYLRSNHYLANILGLLVLGATLRGDPEAPQFFDAAHRAFEREITRQVLDDGVGFEASLPYHALALEMFLIARVIATWADRPFSPRYDARLQRMLFASRTLRHPDGRLPQIGDADSGRILPAGFARPPTLDHLLWLGASVYGCDRPDSSAAHEEVAWTLGLEAWLRAFELPIVPEPDSAAFSSGGFFVLRGSGTHVVARCGDVGQNGNGGHAHNDLLSFEMSSGQPIVIDSGTYLYTANPHARNTFRSTGAHNTIVVAGSEINPLPRDELFTLRQFARPRVESWEQSEREVRLSASHDGYRRLEPPVVHRRTLILNRLSGSLEVADELLGAGWQEAESFLHFAPDVVVSRLEGNRYQICKSGVALALTFSGVQLTDLTEGWVSDSYGSRARAPVLVAQILGELPLRFGFVFERVPPNTPLARTKSEAAP